MPSVDWRPPISRRRWNLASLVPLIDRRFSRVLLFGSWISFVNGLILGAVVEYPKYVLHFSALTRMLLPIGALIGQILLASWVGRFSDRFGNRPTLIICQTLVAFGPFCYLMATPDQPWWLLGTLVLYSAIIGLDICLPNLVLKLSRDDNYAGYTANYFALSGLAFGTGALAGRMILDTFDYDTFYVNNMRLDIYGYLFYIAMITRLLSVLLIYGIDEPKAWSLSVIRRRLILGGRTPADLR
jgi:MFS family permease